MLRKRGIFNLLKQVFQANLSICLSPVSFGQVEVTDTRRVTTIGFYSGCGIRNILLRPGWFNFNPVKFYLKVFYYLPLPWALLLEGG